MFFTASYDSTAKVITAVVFGILAIVAVASGSLLVAGLGTLILASCYAFSPRGYTISGQSILVRRLAGDARIPLDGLRQVRAAAADDFNGSLRLFGNGGVFGYYGLFQTSKLGKCTWYVTRRDHAVVVITAARTALFSPDDVPGFLAALPATAPLLSTQPGDPLNAGQPHSAASRLGKVAGAAVGVAAIAFVAFAMLYSPGPPSYTLTPDSLTIHDRFYPTKLYATNVDVAHVRVVDFGVDTEWRPTGRTNGFANAHYRSGQFRVASGRVVRMYRASSGRMVLLPAKGDGSSVLLETGEPEKFAARVRQQWSRP